MAVCVFECTVICRTLPRYVCTHRIVWQPHGNPRPPTVPLRPPLDPQQERCAFFTGHCSPRLMTNASCRTPIPSAASSRCKEKESTDEIAAPRSRISLDWKESFSTRTFGSLRLKVRPPYRLFLLQVHVRTARF